MVPFGSALMVSALLFVMGLVGVLIRRSALVILMGIELMLNAANLAFVAAARHVGSMDGQLFAFFVMTVAAAEAAVGLAIVIALFRRRRTTDVDQVSFLKW
ncbi:MAG TPA: NADH-quinone oxidoreductase subunit NuoK [Candidatus Polarisedimenticolia bacterium]|nr:NADH-quinone oxidoreductase subunit NuoK [Candidatus Polarisedimenticolia bacterium]